MRSVWFRTKMAIFVAIVNLGLVSAHQAQAQSASPSALVAQSFESSGLRATVSGLKKVGENLFLQFVLINVTNDRQYVLWVGSGSGAMGSGPIIPAAQVAGLSFCYLNINQTTDSNYSECLKEYRDDLDDASYIEPHEFLAVTIRFSDFTTSDNDTLSYILKMIAHSAPPEDQALQAASQGKAVGPARIVDISMPLLPVSQ